MSENFPTDDELSLQQICGTSVDLRFFYAHQFVQDEESACDCEGFEQRHELSRGPVLPRAVTGKVYANEEMVATFNDGTGEVKFTRIGSEWPCPIRGHIDYGDDSRKAAVTLEWLTNMRDTKILVSYEYEMNRDNGR